MGEARKNVESRRHQNLLKRSWTIVSRDAKIGRPENNAENLNDADWG